VRRIPQVKHEVIPRDRAAAPGVPTTPGPRNREGAVACASCKRDDDAHAWKTLRNAVALPAPELSGLLDQMADTRE